MNRPRAQYTDLAAGLLLFLALSYCVNPVGDFPLNDDWAYGLNVKRWILDGHLSYTGWGSMTLLSHIAWGALFLQTFRFFLHRAPFIDPCVVSGEHLRRLPSSYGK